jgi:large subunit ribosomal protein L3
MIMGAVPGSEGGWVLIKDAAKRKAPEGLPFPAALRGDGSEAPPPEAAEEPAAEGVEGPAA